VGFVGLALAASATVLGAVAGSWIAPSAGSAAALLCLVPGVALAAYFAGWRTATLSALIGLAIGWYFFVPPRGSWAIADRRELFLLAAYSLGCAALIALLELAHRARLGAAERRARQLALANEAVGVGTFEWDLATDRIAWSPELEALYGLVPGEFDGRYESWRALLHPDDQGRELVREDVVERDEWNREFRIVRRDGSTRWLLLRAQLLRDGRGRAERLVGINLDVTERKEAEAALEASAALLNAEREQAANALRESEKQRQLAFEANRVGTFHAELGTQRVSVSPELRALLELPPEGSLTTEEAMALIDASDLAELRRRFASALAGESQGRVSVDIRVGARPRWLAFNAQIEFREGAAGREPVRVTGVGIDITERKRAELQLRDGEKLLRAFVNNSAAIAWMKDEQGRYVFLSENFQRLLLHADAALGKTDFELWPHALAAQHAQGDAAVLAADASREGIERMPAADGSETWWRTAKFPFRDPEGRRYVGGIAVDVSAERRAEEQLREADRRKDRFLATLAHELRSPLAPLLNAVSLLEQKSLAEAEIHYCRELIGRQVEQITRLLDDLLDISRITLGKVALRRRTLELSGIVERAVEMAQPLADARAHKLEVRLPEAPIFLDADLTRLVQVFANLLGNSARYTPPGGSIQLTAERIGEVVQVRVRDDGEGIAPEDLPRVFEMFGTGMTSQGRTRDGLGIGLALSRGLVELHGGRLTGHSEGLGRGAEFCVELPVLAASSSSASGSDEPARHGLAVHAPQRVLVADDLRDSADSMALVLELAGHEVRAAYDGAEAVELARAALPDVVVLDIGMPRLDGYAACRAIRALPGGDRILMIALTGWGQPEDRRKAREAGFDHHLTKPVDPMRLRELLAKEAGARRTHQGR